MICFLAPVLHRALRQRLRAAGSTFSVQRTLALLARIQKHSVKIHHQPITGTSRMTSEQHDLFKAIALSPPREDNPL